MRSFKKDMKDALRGEIGPELLDLLPSGYHNVGGIVILSLNPELGKYKTVIGRCLLEMFPNMKTICIKFDGIKGDKRVPSVEKVAGNGTETVHKENGCSYKLDVTKVMFSKGNTVERGRLAGIVKKNETVVDMFAGIGYFSIPIAKSCAAKIYSIEINPEAAHYLMENIRLNKLRNIEAIECDSRKAPEKLKGVADRVIMGYFPGTEKFLDAAFYFLKPSGGIVHYHNIYRDDELWDKPVSELGEAGKSHGMKLDVLDRHIVKNYAPHVQHVVVDAKFTKI